MQFLLAYSNVFHGRLVPIEHANGFWIVERTNTTSIQDLLGVHNYECSSSGRILRYYWLNHTALRILCFQCTVLTAEIGPLHLAAVQSPDAAAVVVTGPDIYRSCLWVVKEEVCQILTSLLVGSLETEDQLCAR